MDNMSDYFCRSTPTEPKIKPILLDGNWADVPSLKVSAPGCYNYFKKMVAFAIRIAMRVTV